MLGQDRFIVRQCNRGHCKQAALFTEKEISPPHKLMSARLVPRPSACVIRSFPLRQSGASPRHLIQAPIPLLQRRASRNGVRRSRVSSYETRYRTRVVNNLRRRDRHSASFSSPLSQTLVPSFLRNRPQPPLHIGNIVSRIKT